jgi:hypothetical protein
MTKTVSCNDAVDALRSASTAGKLADRLEQGARALGELARSLTDAQWQTVVPEDGRTVGVVVHHVASVYPVEIHLAQTVASGHPITDLTMEDVHAMNARHAAEFTAITREAALDLLERNSAAAAAAIRALNEKELARAASVSLYAGAPLTCQFLLEDHAVRHSYHHTAAITRALRSHATSC